MTQTELIEKARRGERITKADAPNSIIDAKKDVGEHRHNWRPIVCDSDHDVCECGDCGEQRVFVCNFDDDMS
jgi:hypothetical protein